MSISDQILRISNEVTSQTDLINQIKTALNGRVASVLQEKTVTPSVDEIVVVADSSFNALSKVTVEGDENLVPENIAQGVSIFGVNGTHESGADTSVVTASAADVLAGKVIVDANGNSTTGTMTNNGAVSQTLNTSTTSYTIPEGYHNGSGTVSITTETKTATPSSSEQIIVPTSGNVISSVSVAAIPSTYCQVVTGTFSPSIRYDTTVTVSGLGFTPKVLYMVSSGTGNYNPVSWASIDTLSGVYNYLISTDGISSLEQASDTVFSADGSLTDDSLLITLTSDGFTITVSGGAYGGGIQFSSSLLYHYIAVG